MIDNKLIQSALGLTGKTMGDMEEIIATNIMDYHNTDIYPEFSIEKFCYYLLSPEFIEKYKKENEFAIMDDGFSYNYYAECFGQAIYEYQSGNEQPLIDLLSKTK